MKRFDSFFTRALIAVFCSALAYADSSGNFTATGTSAACTATPATFNVATSRICMEEETEYSETATIVAKAATRAGLRENLMIPWVRRAIVVRGFISGSLQRGNARKMARRSRI